MTSNRTILPDDVLSLIFKNLEPCFLIDVMKATKQLNKAASSDFIFFDKMHRYFPDQPTQTSTIASEVTYKAKHLFSKLYAEQFKTLKSSASRRLLSYIIEEDVEKIREFKINGEELFAMLSEKDANGRDMFFYANRTKNTAVRSALMELYLRPFIAAEHSWNPLTIIGHNARKMFFETELGRFLILSTSAKHIYEVAAAFGVTEHLKGLEREHTFHRDTYVAALSMAARFGHIRAVEYLLQLSAHFEVEWTLNRIELEAWQGAYPERHPVVAAAMNNQPEMVRLLLLKGGAVSSHPAWRFALSAALKFRHKQVLEVLIDVLSNEKFQDIHPNRLLYAALSDVVQYDYDELVEMILQKVFDNDAVMSDQERAKSFNTFGALDRAVRNGLKHGSIKSLELIFRRYDQLKSDGLIIQDQYYDDKFPETVWWELAIAAGDIKIMNLLIKHEYPVSEQSIDLHGCHHREPEIVTFLQSLRHQVKDAQVDTISKITPM